MSRLLAAPDKFRGTATAVAAAAAMVRGAVDAGWAGTALPMSDGGEGFLDCLGGPDRVSVVRGPDGTPVRAPWQLRGTRAVVEMAAASGLRLVGPRNDPMAASSAGTGQLVAQAIAHGAQHVLVGAGGSATTDGGWGAVGELLPLAPLDGSRGYLVEVATDVEVRFVDSARVFAPQKGATPAQVATLTRRLEELATRYRDEFGVDVTAIAGAGAAGGLAGGLAALGARIRSGSALVATLNGLDDAIRACDLVVTGEGSFDATSWRGKAPAHVLQRCRALRVPAAVVAGRVENAATGEFRFVSLTDRFGPASAEDTEGCIRAAVRELLIAGPGP